MTRIAFLTALVVFSTVPVMGAGDPPKVAAKTIAVLDFVNRNPGDGRDWLGKGLADMVITDLSASRRLTVVDRQRVQELTREVELGVAGILDPKTAPRVGKIAKVRWVLFGTFAHRGADVSIEAILIDVDAGKTVRIEQIEGPAGKLFGLEQRVVEAILGKLDVPMTEEELRLVKLLKTQSLPAFEHYARSLGLFDAGQWFEALREARLARRADPAYLPAAIRLAQLFYEVGEPEHAVIEYRRFAEQDRDDKLPANVYFAFGKILERAFADRAAAIAVFQRLVRRQSQYDKPFRITDPPPPSHAWNNGKGLHNAEALFEEHKASLEAMEQVASWQLEAGEGADALRLYGQLWLWLNTQGLPSGGAGTVFRQKVAEKYGPLYWRLVLENRDAAFYPACPIHLLPTDKATVDPKTAPTHETYDWIPGGNGTSTAWLAPPDHEIAEVSFALEDDGSEASKYMAKEFGGKTPIDFKCMGYPSILGLNQPQVKPDGAWHTVKFERGIRALQITAWTTRWQMKFVLRRWTSPAKIPDVGTFQVNFLPEVADMYVNGKRRGPFRSGLCLYDEPTGPYAVEVRWPDGRRRSTAFEIVKGKRGEAFLNADLDTVSRQVIATEGSNACLLTDRGGRLWLLWDQVCRDDMMSLNLESSLFCATSCDGMQWSRPRRLPVSSLDCDTTPILQQDRRGMFWLLWVSSRDPQASKSLWIASSPNGVEWSFPRKVVLPEMDKGDWDRWRGNGLPRPAFAIDTRGVFWLVWQGWLLRSEDAQCWKVESVLHTGEKGDTADNWYGGKGYALFGASNRLLLVATYLPKGNSQMHSVLWQRDASGHWERAGVLTEQLYGMQHAGTVAIRDDGAILGVVQSHGGLWFSEFAADGSKSEPLCVESYLSNPFHPAVASLPNGRFLVAFGSKGGLVAAVLQRDEAAAKVKNGKAKDEGRQN